MNEKDINALADVLGSILVADIDRGTDHRDGDSIRAETLVRTPCVGRRDQPTPWSWWLVRNRWRARVARQSAPEIRRNHRIFFVSTLERDITTRDEIKTRTLQICDSLRNTILCTQ